MTVSPQNEVGVRSDGRGRLRLAQVSAQHEGADPIDELAQQMKVKSIAVRAVDRFELAASLESDGITDATARVQFGCPDVFVLADEILERREPRPVELPASSLASQSWASAVRDCGHGALYLLPALVFPVGLAVVDDAAVLTCLLVLGAIAWIWAGGSAWLAYRMLSRGLPGAAARVLQRATILGLLFAVAVSTALIHLTGIGFGLVGMGLAVMAFQMASTLVMLYRREELLYRAMAAGVLAGVVYLAGLVEAGYALAVVVASLVAALIMALHQTRGRATGPEPGLQAGLRGELGHLPLILLYTALSAVFLLFAQSRFLFGELAILVGFLPLFAAMGFVEWRARRFLEKARALLRSVRYPREHTDRVRRLLAREMALCGVAVTILATFLFAILESLGVLRSAAVLLSVSCAVLAAAYLVGFLLANMGRYWALCGCLAVGTGVHLGLIGLVPDAAPVTEALIFVAIAVLLLVTSVAAVYPLLNQVKHFR